jgi:vacuolar-type H+-ATPase subunit E/Vma4
MVEKKKSRIPSVRALDALFQRYDREINQKTDQEETNRLNKIISTTKDNTAKELLEYLRKCLENYNTPYQETKEKCSWHHTTIANGTITMYLSFKDSESIEVSEAMKKLKKIEESKTNEKKRLETWYDDSLLKIVNRIDVKPFEVN